MTIQVNLPDGSVVNFPDGTPQAEMESALAAHAGSAPPSTQMQQGLSQLSALTRNPAVKATADQRTVDEYMAMPAWKRRLTDAVDIPALVAQGGSMGLLDKAAAAVRSPFTDKTYEEELAINRKQTEDARARQGWLGTAAELTGGIGSGLGLAKKGVTLAGRGGTAAMPGLKGIAARTGLMGVEGAGYGGVNAFGADEDIGTGAGLGLLFGLGGSAVGDLASEAGSRLGKAYTKYVAPAADRVKQQVYEAAEAVGLPNVNAMLQRAPDAMNVDVLGARGHGMARNASNYSPEAEELFKEAMSGRKANQNPRVAAKLREAGEIPEATTYESLKRGAYEKQRPAINQAYDAARDAGADLPREPFRDILATPMGAKAYDDAADALLNRTPTQGGAANSELARLDQMKRILDAKATMAFRAGDNDTGQQAADLAKLLRQRMDDSIAGPEYAKARDLRRQGYAIDESFDIGANLAKPRIDLDAPGKAAKAASPKAVAKAYAAEMQERLLNKQNTEGAINMFATPMAKQAQAAALGPRASIVDDAIANERLYEQTNKALVGNSSTTKQLIGAGLLGAGAGYWQGGFDLGSMGTGAAALMALKKGGPAALKYIGSRRQAAEAPLLAQELLKRGISPNRPIPAGVLEKFSKSQREAIKRALMLGMNNQYNQPAER